MIPGLDIEDDLDHMKKDIPRKKVPFAKPVPKNFEQAWESGAQPSSGDGG